MKTLALISVVILLSCNNMKIKKQESNSSNKSEVVKYLKERFHVSVDTAKIDSNYRKWLIEKKQNLNGDSLISSRVLIDEYAPLNLNFITFDNYFGIPDTTHENHFSVKLIQDKSSGKFYVDFINDKAGYITEDYCSWLSMDNRISLKDTQTTISKKNIAIYNSINSYQIFGEREYNNQYKRNGIQAYLNSTFQFAMPEKGILDSFLLSYDKSLYKTYDTLLTSRGQLYDFLSVQAIKIRSQPDYGSREASLTYLKSQINLLFIQTEKRLEQNVLYWIYKNNSSLRVRRLLISGNKKSTFSYFLDEYEICFF